ncbi:MAG: diacylglycerol kinase family protein [Myxococcota bacterium]|nr:diacylglycerol kinase family protein [Myxococcota bacterium]
MKRAAIICNPVAGSGQATAMTERAREILASDGVAVEHVATRGPGETESLVRTRAGSIDLLLVAGGDGSIREAIAGLGDDRRRVPVAILPCGNANVVARELGVPQDAEAALEVLRSGVGTPIDVGRIGSELFLAMVGIGWDARAVHHLSRLRQTSLGRHWYRLWADSAYLVAGLAAAFDWPLGRVRITVDGQPAGPAYCALQVANFRNYGKGWAMVPDAHPLSARLHFQARKRAGPASILWQVLAAMSHRRAPHFISDHGDGKKLVVEADRPFAVQVDGDDRGSFTRVEIQIEPHAASILAPATQ